MAKAISVKVATPKVITALETKLATLKKDYESQEANEAKYQKAYEKYRKALADFAMANIKTATNIRTNYRSWSNSLNIDFDVDTKSANFPEEPQRDFEQMNAHAYKDICSEINNALSILRMTDEETVNASTMKSI
jgi:hypothetical protein